MEARIEATIGAIYDTALDPGAWPAALSRLAGLFGCVFADSFQRTDDYSQFTGIQHGLAESDYKDEFLGIWVKRNVWGTLRPVVRAGDVVTTREIVPRDELVRTAMYADYLAPRGLHEGLRLDVWASDGWIEDVSLLRPWSAGAYTAEELRLARTLLPHLQRATAMAHRLRGAERIAAAALEASNGPLLVVDRNGRLLHANMSAEALLQLGDGLSAGSAGLEAANTQGRRALHRMLSATPGRGGAAWLDRPSGKPALAAIAIPLKPHLATPGLGSHCEPAFLLSIADPEATLPVSAHLAELYGLTPAEQLLAADLLAGEDVQSIAARRRRSVNTVRTQLSSLLQKTGARRQSDLIRLLARLPGEAES